MTGAYTADGRPKVGETSSIPYIHTQTGGGLVYGCAGRRQLGRFG